MKLGIVGAGQLARMLALAGIPLGLEFECVGQSGDPAEALSTLVPSPRDPAAWCRWLQRLDALTFESENVDFTMLEGMEEACPFAPSLSALRVASDRLLEKRLFTRLGLRRAPFFPVDTLPDLWRALETCGSPGWLKVRRFGFDGRGQVRVTRDNVEQAWQEFSLKQGGLVYEKHVDFQREVSQLLVRGRDGQTLCYPLSENQHRQGILCRSTCPAEAGEALAAEAKAIAESLACELDYVGVLAVEMFQVDGGLWVNEIAPRVHNSGHWSIEASVTSQFENHLRAVCGLPLGSCKTRPAVMLNCLGEMPPRSRALSIEGLHYHDYAKSPRPGRKLGHVTLLLDHPESAQSVARVERLLGIDVENALV